LKQARERGHRRTADAGEMNVLARRRQDFTAGSSNVS
jgi:hypothetical protein